MRKFGTFQIPVDSFNETPGGGRMGIATANRDDSSPSTTPQRQHDAVYETPRLRCPDPYPYGHAGVAVSRILWENDANRTVLPDLQALPLSTAFPSEPPVGNAVQRCKAPVAKRSSAWSTAYRVVTLGRPLLASEYLCELTSPAIPPSCRRLSPSVLPQRGADASVHPRDAVKDLGVLSQR